MKKLITFISLVSLSCLASASDSPFQWSAGVGHQHGGAIGVQLSYNTGTTKFYGAAGLIGGAIGFESTFNSSSQHSYGLVVGREEIVGEDGFAFVTYNYHPTGFNQKGWVYGTGIGVTRQDEGSLFADIGETETIGMVTLNVAYKF